MINLNGLNGLKGINEENGLNNRVLSPVFFLEKRKNKPFTSFKPFRLFRLFRIIQGGKGDEWS